MLTNLKKKLAWYPKADVKIKLVNYIFFLQLQTVSMDNQLQTHPCHERHLLCLSNCHESHTSILSPSMYRVKRWTIVEAGWWLYSLPSFVYVWNVPNKKSIKIKIPGPRTDHVKEGTTHRFIYPSVFCIGQLIWNLWVIAIGFLNTINSAMN